MEPYSEVSSVALSDEEVVAVVSVAVSVAEASPVVRAVAVVPLGAGKRVLQLIS